MNEERGRVAVRKILNISQNYRGRMWDDHVTCNTLCRLQFRKILHTGMSSWKKIHEYEGKVTMLLNTLTADYKLALESGIFQ